MKNSTYPVLFQINTRVWLTEFSRKLGRKATLDDIPDSAIEAIASQGFEWVWMLSVWQTGETGQQVSRQHPGWLAEFHDTLADLTVEDIAGSGFAIARYVVSRELGGDEALARLRKRLADHGLKMMLDFVPNHTARDHHWIYDHPDYYVEGNETDLQAQPDNLFRQEGPHGRILAHGRDPFFSGWVDTAQLNYGNSGLQQAMTEELKRISGQCDGLRCDMAMLVLPEVFLRTWHIQAQPFWPRAIQAVRELHDDFCFMAEVYWDMEWIMIQQGFNYAYDKRLYDRLKEGEARPVREHLLASLDYQSKMARFLENHDEPRVAAEFPMDKHKAAAIITFLSPGLRFFHQGQQEGRKKKISPHLVRAPEEPVNNDIHRFYDRLLGILREPAFRNGRWKLLECMPAWEGNPSHENFICFAWENEKDEKTVVAVNYAPYAGQCYVKLPFDGLADTSWSLHDLLSEQTLGRDGNDLAERGLYLDEPGWKTYVFLLTQDKTDI
jgi:hypothetical protein